MSHLRSDPPPPGGRFEDERGEAQAAVLQLLRVEIEHDRDHHARIIFGELALQELSALDEGAEGHAGAGAHDEVDINAVVERLEEAADVWVVHDLEGGGVERGRRWRLVLVY